MGQDFADADNEEDDNGSRNERAEASNSDIEDKASDYEMDSGDEAIVAEGLSKVISSKRSSKFTKIYPAGGAENVAKGKSKKGKNIKTVSTGDEEAPEENEELKVRDSWRNDLRFLCL